MSERARWVVTVYESDVPPTDVDPIDMVIGPFTSEARAEHLARKVNEGLDGLGAEVSGLYPVRDPDTKAALLAWAGAIAGNDDD